MIGPKIKKLRNQKGYSQEYLAECLEISQATLSNIESGKTKLNIGIIQRICKELEFDILELIESEKTACQENTVQTVGYIAETQTFYISNKLIEQYEVRIKELQERITELKEEVIFWKEQTC